MPTLVTLLAVAMLVLIPATAAATAVMAHMLKARFPTVWAAEGRPERWLWLLPMPASGNVLRFLDERRYAATGSLSFTRFCAAVRAAWYISLLVSALALVAGLAWALQAQA
jgi:hypothetical protein